MLETRAVAPTTDEDEVAQEAYRKLHPALAAEYVDNNNTRYNISHWRIFKKNHSIVFVANTTLDGSERYSNGET